MLSRESLGTSEVNERANRVDPREVSTDDQRLAAQHIENTSRRWPREAGVRRKPGMVLVVATIGLRSACAQQAGRVYRVTAVRDGASGANVVTASDLASGGEGRPFWPRSSKCVRRFWEGMDGSRL